MSSDIDSPEVDEPGVGESEAGPSQPEKPPLDLEVSISEVSACQRHVTVTIPRPDIDRYFEDALDEFQPSAEVPGFRPGKAPRKLVQSRYRQQMKDQVKGSLLMDGVTQATEKCEFSAISEPDFDFEVIELPDEGPMTFEFDIEVRPEFELPEWKGLALTRSVHEYSDDEVRDHLHGLLARYGQMVTRNEPVEPDDYVVVDITVRHGDEPVSRQEGQTIQVKPKLSFRDANVEGFDQLMNGAQAGEHRETTVQVIAGDSRWKDQELTVRFDIKAVKRMRLPELTPAFLDKIGGFEDEEELAKAVRQELDRQVAYYQQRQIRDQITNLLTAGADWELPPDLLKRQANRELERAVLELQASGFGQQEIRARSNQLRQNSAAATERALKEHFILERIAEEHELEATEQDFTEEIRLIAQQSDESPRRVRARLEKRGQMDALRNQIIERKAIEMITKHADFQDKPFDMPDRDDAVAVDRALTEGDEVIPEAKYGGETQELPGSNTKTKS